MFSFSKKVMPLFRLTSMETSLMHRKGVVERRPLELQLST
jgi:hypothetical protein